MTDWKNIDNLIMGSNHILLATHENPDGDGLGSIAALYHHLLNKGKDCRCIQFDVLTYEYQFLNTDDIFEIYDQATHQKWLDNADLAVLLDIGNFDRVPILKKRDNKNGLTILNIDHHPHHDKKIFDYNVIDTSVAATGELIYDYLKNINNEEIAKEIYIGLYTAILTDTGSFSYSNTTVRSHEIAIESLKAGVDSVAIYQKVYESSSLGKVKLLGTIIDQMNYELDGKLIWFLLDRKMLSEAGAIQADVDGFTDFVRKIRGVEVAMMIFEYEKDLCRINFRSSGNYVVNKIADQFGGGGHAFAAGAKVPGQLKEVLKTVLNETITQIQDQESTML